MDPNDSGQDEKASSGHNDASPNENAFHTRQGYFLSSASDGRSGGAGSERWRGDRYEKREELRLRRIWRVSLRHLRFVGPGLVSSVRSVLDWVVFRCVLTCITFPSQVAYFDP
jgi:hypothetical protein